MHQVETLGSPAPLTSDQLHLPEVVYVYNSRVEANTHAEKFARDRMLKLGPHVTCVPREIRDHNDHLAGSGYVLARTEQYPDGSRRMTQREVVWVVRQWRDDTL